MTTTVRILGSRAREQVPGTSITLLAPGFRGAMTQLGANEAPAGVHALPFARAAAGAEVMIAAHLSMHLESRLPGESLGLRTRSAVAAHPRIIVPRRNGVAYTLLQTDEQGFSSFVPPEARDSSEAVFPLTVAAGGETQRTMRLLMWPEQPVSGPGALAAVCRWERLRRPNQLQQLGLRGWQIPDWDQLRRGPLLLLLHGTFGTPHGTFLDWIGHESFHAVSQRYEGRCLAFAHPTLGHSLEENAAWLTAHLLAISAPIDVVAHGRGGLLARLLAADDRLSLRRVCQLGTPNQGTALALAAQLARFVEGHVALLARAPQQKAEAILEGALCMTRFAGLDPPVELPGMTAMTPGSSTARALTGLGPRQQWFTIGADYARPEGHRVNAAVNDEFESAPNDLVVPAAGCHLPGVTPAESLRIGGAYDHHHNYFANRQVRERLDAWLR
jgi:pimeloyl-ACP methyl ester carboxylesterase